MISAFSLNVHSKQGLLEPFRFMNSIVPLAGAEVECRNMISALLENYRRTKERLERP